MTQASAQAAEGTPVSGWLLPGSQESRLRIEQVVAKPSDHEDRRTHRPRFLGELVRKALVEEIEATLRGLLSETLADLVVGGWRVHGAIRAAVRKSRAEPGVDQVVPLQNHTVKADRRHELVIEVDGVKVMTLAACLTVELQVYNAVAVVRDGHLVSVRSGEAHATGDLTVEGVQIARRTLTFPITAELTLHRPPNMSD